MSCTPLFPGLSASCDLAHGCSLKYWRLGAGLPLGVVLNFLLQLGFREAGTAFALSALDNTQRAISTDMSQLGLLMPFKWDALPF